MVHVAAAGLMTVGEELVGVGQTRVTGGDFLQVAKLISIRCLHVSQEVFELLKLRNLVFNARVLVPQCLQPQLCLLDLPVFLLNFL